MEALCDFSKAEFSSAIPGLNAVSSIYSGAVQFGFPSECGCGALPLCEFNMRLKTAAILTIFAISCINLHSSLVGTWLVVIENGKDISKKRVTYIITEDSISQSVPGLCGEKAAFSVSGNNFTAVTTESNCPWSFAGKKNSGVLFLKGDQLTLTFPEHGKTFSQICIKKK